MVSSDSLLLSARDPAEQVSPNELLSFGSIGSACRPSQEEGSTSAAALPFADMTTELIDFFQKAPIALHWLSGK